MERVWVFDRLAISVARIDFLDPKVADEPDARERGVRIEVRRASTETEGTIYVSSSMSLQPAICRIDFLESAPGAADRMHWHPDMPYGEPGDRTLDADMPADPVGWLTSYLRNLREFLVRAGVPDVETMTCDLEDIEATADEIGTAVADGLAWTRSTPWLDLARDESGMPAQAAPASHS
jgi:hypothetical protein